MFPVFLSLPVHSYFRRFKDYVQFQLTNPSQLFEYVWIRR